MKVWDKDAVKAALLRSDVFVERALLALHARQDDDEQALGVTKKDNGRGFNKMDASFLTSLAEWAARNKDGYPDGYRLSPKQKAAARRRLSKYAGQLVEIAHERNN
jgi:hypothetical protein